MPLFSLGFRIFFLSAAVSALLSMGLWLGYLSGLNNLYPLAGKLWHSHELLMGYGLAVLCGFLLTAIRNWTGQYTWDHKPLLMLWLLWLGARLGYLLPLPVKLTAFMDIAFNIAALVAISTPLLRARNSRNYGFIAIFAGITLANLLFYAALLGGYANLYAYAMQLAVLAHLFTLLIIAGRIMPFFTERVTGLQRKTWPLLEQAMIVLCCALTLLSLLPLPVAFSGALWCALAVAAALRYAGWYHKDVRRHPLLWILHGGYLTLVLGMAGYGLSLIWLPQHSTAWLHVIVLALLGSLMLGMMARVSLGHTGRPLEVRPVIVGMFAVILALPLVRSVLPLLLPNFYMPALHLAACLWMLCMLVFLWVYVPVLSSPRPDGKAG
ncbi:MAG: NnrS family protein [Oceanospirillaceae bacterium]|nr:NnrS family protein [Oceanospirillaceae bacterium]MCP5349768.1 NnrS family protein [Oceanospirillaceae bacterium]